MMVYSAEYIRHQTLNALVVISTICSQEDGAIMAGLFLRV